MSTRVLPKKPKKPGKTGNGAFIKRLDASWENAIRKARRDGRAEDVHERLDAKLPYTNRYEKRGISLEEFRAIYRSSVEMALTEGTQTAFLPFMDEAFCYVEWMLLSKEESDFVCGWMIENDPLELSDDDWEVEQFFS